MLVLSNDLISEEGSCGEASHAFSVWSRVDIEVERSPSSFRTKSQNQIIFSVVLAILHDEEVLQSAVGS